ncbi:collagen-like triple helix repeat-containing protein [Longitalea arenae]|uniref:collagen-like triple helix repeat-containing protein n=1 Tax=Longitalea arenae TaxID=2812558 RepID=UPI0019681300|nr:collagen-like protein [Longitalea arenae]
MKRTNQWSLHHFFYYMLAVALTISACKKGDTGPQGEKGDKGDKGDTGQTGQPGSKGDPGTANVQYSAWLDLAFTLDQGSNVYFTQINEPKVTDELLSNGEIKVYVNLGTPANKVITALPYRSGNAVITPFFATGIIELNANGNASTFTDPANGNKFLQYRYILVPGGTHVRMNKQIDWNNYEEVKAHLGLKD